MFFDLIVLFVFKGLRWLYIPVHFRSVIVVMKIIVQFSLVSASVNFCAKWVIRPRHELVSRRQLGYTNYIYE